MAVVYVGPGLAFVGKASFKPGDILELRSVIYGYAFEDPAELIVIEMIADAAVELQEREAEEGNAKLKSYKKRVEECDRGINNIITAIERGVSTREMEARLLDLSEQKQEMLEEMAGLEVVQPAVSRDQVVAWLRHFRDGDPSDPEFQLRIIESFVTAVFVYDDRITITYRYTKGRAGDEIVFDKSASSSTIIRSREHIDLTIDAESLVLTFAVRA